MSDFTKVIKNTLAQGLGRFGVVLLTVVATALLTRILGPAGYGNYVFALTLVVFFTTIADWGTSLIFVREVVKSKNEESFFGNALLFRLVLAAISLLFMNLLSYFIPGFALLPSTVVLASFLLIFISLKTSCHIVFQTKQQFENIALVDVSVSLFFLGLLAILAFLARWIINVNLVIACYLVANLLGVVLAFILSLRISRFNFQPNKAILKKIVFEALPTGALLLTFGIYNRIDIFILQMIKGAEPVGVYGLAYKVYDNLVLLAAYLMSSLFPALSAIAGNDEFQTKIKTVYQKIFDILLLAGVLVGVGVFILAPLVIAIIGGPPFTASTIVLRILVVANLFAYFNHLTGYTLIALGRQRFSLVVAVVALVGNIFLNLILIPHYSYIGAAVVTVATEALVLILTSFYLAKNFGLVPRFSVLETVKELIKMKGKINW